MVLISSQKYRNALNKSKSDLFTTSDLLYECQIEINLHLNKVKEHNYYKML